jgi:hypothetical protein
MPTIDVNGANIFYHQTGTGEPVVLLHCSASTGGQ